MILEKRWYRYKSRQSQYRETAHNNLRSRILKSYHILIQGLHGANRLLCPFSGNEHYTFRLLLHATCICGYVIINLQTWDNPFSSSRWVLPYIFTCIHCELLIYSIYNIKYNKYNIEARNYGTFMAIYAMLLTVSSSIEDHWYRLQIQEVCRWPA